MKTVLEYISFIEQIATKLYSVTGIEVEKQLLSKAKKKEIKCMAGLLSSVVHIQEHLEASPKF